MRPMSACVLVCSAVLVGGCGDQDPTHQAPPPAGQAPTTGRAVPEPAGGSAPIATPGKDNGPYQGPAPAPAAPSAPATGGAHP